MDVTEFPTDEGDTEDIDIQLGQTEENSAVDTQTTEKLLHHNPILVLQQTAANVERVILQLFLIMTALDGLIHLIIPTVTASFYVQSDFSNNNLISWNIFLNHWSTHWKEFTSI